MTTPPRSVLFVCNLNRVRSPMAAGLTRKLYGGAVVADSCGLQPGEAIDPMVVAVMQEIGVDLVEHQPRGLADFKAAAFERIIALSHEAFARAQVFAAGSSAPVACWPTEDPTGGEGSRDMRLDAYRLVRRQLEARIIDQFGPPREGA